MRPKKNAVNFNGNTEANTDCIDAGDMYRTLFNISKDIIYSLDTNMKITSANNSFYRSTGYNAVDIEGKPIESVPELKIAGKQWHQIFNYITGSRECREYETQTRLQDGTVRFYNVSLTPVLDRDKNVTGIIGINHDITRIKQSENEIRQLVYHDPLTGLPNRLMFEERLGEVISLCSRNKQRFGVLFLDLDNFKKVNDTLGHGAGDMLLKEVGTRLHSGARKHDVISRIGGDEFAIILLDVNKPRNIGRFAERLLKLFEIPFVIGQHTIYITPSIGISVYPDDSDRSEDLLQNIDTAMYKAKNNGKNNYQFYDAIMKEEITKKVTIEKYLRRAIQNNELSLNYQPLINTRTGKVRGFEALLRWNCREIGSIPPIEFIPVAEECSFIIPIEEWVLRTACMKKKEWEIKYNSKALISVNISALHFRQEDFVNRVCSILNQTGLSPEYLEIEITESILINYLDDVVKKLKDLRKTGIRISLDDFGTGYSSLSYLRMLPLDTLKIDKTFIHGISKKTKDKYFVKSIVSLVHKYELDIVAEGVETAEQFQYLSKCRCDYVQGYLLGRPVAECDSIGILNDGRVDLKSISAPS